MKIFNDCIVYYINLHDDIERRINVEKQLYNIFDEKDVVRFEAYYDEYGPYGVGISHIEVLKKALLQSKNNIFIFEDDVEWTLDKEQIYDIINSIDDYDITLLYYNIGHMENVLTYKKYEKNKNLFLCNNARSCAGYLINKKFIQKLLEVWENTVPNIKKYKPDNFPYLIDRSWNILENNNKFFCTIPRLLKIKGYYSHTAKEYISPGGYCIIAIKHNNINTDNINTCFQYKIFNEDEDDNIIFKYLLDKHPNLNYIMIMNKYQNLIFDKAYKIFGYICYLKLDYVYEKDKNDIFFVSKKKILGESNITKKITLSNIIKK